MRAFLVLVVLVHAASAEPLGETCNPAACEAVARGVTAMHSFWYTRATAELVAAEKADPGCAIAYAVDALSRIRMIVEDELDGARAALARMPSAERATSRERAWIAAVEKIVAGPDPFARHAAFRDAFEPVRRAFPDDDAAAAFVALGTFSREGGANLADDVKAAALVFDILAHNPNHPGALHYAIHALDTPELAPLALPAARRYAQAAPAAFHAEHVPAHIFSRLGMWNEALERCEAAWKTSVDWVAAEHLAPGERDFHSLSGLPGIRLEMGQPRAADGALARFGRALAEGAPPIVMHIYVMAVEIVASETGDWRRVDALLAAAAKSPRRARAEAATVPRRRPVPWRRRSPTTSRCCAPAPRPRAATARRSTASSPSTRSSSPRSRPCSRASSAPTSQGRSCASGTRRPRSRGRARAATMPPSSPPCASWPRPPTRCRRPRVERAPAVHTSASATCSSSAIGRPTRPVSTPPPSSSTPDARGRTSAPRAPPWRRVTGSRPARRRGGRSRSGRAPRPVSARRRTRGRSPARRASSSSRAEDVLGVTGGRWIGVYYLTCG